MANEQQKKELELLGRVNDLLEIKKEMSVPGEKYNIFSVLDRERKEVTTHCRLIGEFLDKNGSHGMGDVFLREFFPIVLGIKDYPEDGANVELEKVIDEGRMDFCILGNGFYYPIEAKIDAGDQPEQIKRYYTEAQNNAAQKKADKFRVYYLTLDGHEPSKESLGSVKIEEIECISFDIHIRQWLERCTEIAWKAPNITEIIRQYLKLLDKLTGKSDFVIKHVEKLIRGSEKYFESALEIAKHVHTEDNKSAPAIIREGLYNVRTEIMWRFFSDLDNRLQEKCKLERFHFSHDYEDKVKNYYNYHINKGDTNTNPSLAYRIKSLTAGTEIILRFEIGDRFYYGINICNESKKGEYKPLKGKKIKSDETLKKAIISAFKCDDWETKVNSLKNIPWLWKQYLPSGKDCYENTAADDKIELNFRTCRGRYEHLLDDAKREKLIDEIVDKVKEQLPNILKTGCPNNLR